MTTFLDQIVWNMGAHLYAYDAETGNELWSGGSLANVRYFNADRGARPGNRRRGRSRVRVHALSYAALDRMVDDDGRATQSTMIEILVGMNVTNDDMYAEYRRNMSPILEAHGGSFIVDVKVSEVLRAPKDATFNRLFSIRFPSQQQLDAFFSNPAYLAVRERYFVPSTAGFATLGTYEPRVT